VLVWRKFMTVCDSRCSLSWASLVKAQREVPYWWLQYRASGGGQKRSCTCAQIFPLIPEKLANSAPGRRSKKLRPATTRRLLEGWVSHNSSSSVTPRMASDPQRYETTWRTWLIFLRDNHGITKSWRRDLRHCLEFLTWRQDQRLRESTLRT